MLLSSSYKNKYLILNENYLKSWYYGLSHSSLLLPFSAKNFIVRNAYVFKGSYVQ